MRSHLKVKVYTLAQEMTYIRRQEDKWKNRARFARAKQQALSNPEVIAKTAASLQYAENNFWTNRWHRENLKADARWSHLAYGFMKGRSYQQMEYICHGDTKGKRTMPPHWARIEEIVAKFSKDEPEIRDIMQRFGEWLAAAKVWYDGNPDRILEAQKERRAQYDAALADPAYQAMIAARHKEAEAWGRKCASGGWSKTKDGWWHLQERDLEESDIPY